MWSNALRAHLATGAPAAGAIVPIPAEPIVEILGLIGFNFVFLDAEHGSLSPDGCERLVRAAEGHGITPLVRVPSNDPHLILRYLDTGAHGVIVPHITTADDARRAVDAALYHPLGQRGLAGIRAARYGLDVPLAEYTVHVNRELSVIALIEDAHAIEHLPEIMAVEGLNAIHIGPTDLSQSLGRVNDRYHPDVEQAIDEIISQARKADMPVGIATSSGQDAVAAIQRGCQIVTYSAWAMLASAGRDYLAAVHGH